MSKPKKTKPAKKPTSKPPTKGAANVKPYERLAVRSMVKLYNTFAPDPRERFASRAHGLLCLRRLVKEKLVNENSLNSRANELLAKGKATRSRMTRNRHGRCGIAA